MSFPSENTTRRHGCSGRIFIPACRERPAARRAFTLVESMAAVTLLVFIGASVWIILERCMVSVTDSTQRMRAFEVARENMERLLGSTSVQETSEYGTSEDFPDIRWHTTVESFYEPLTARMWIQAICSAEYSDSADETKSVELTHWLTDLTKEQLEQLMRNREQREKELAEHIIETEELAAQYAGVTVETIRQWVQNGMPLGPGGTYLKPWLDLYLQTDGMPSEQDRQILLQEYPELAGTTSPGTDVSQPDGDEQDIEPDFSDEPEEDEEDFELTDDEEFPDDFDF